MRSPKRNPARDAGVRVAPSDGWGDIFSRVLLERIEPHLGNGQATILYDYPAVQSPLARPKPSIPGLAERWDPDLLSKGLLLAAVVGAASVVLGVVVFSRRDLQS